MRITLINQFFHPDLSATAQIATELAVDLVQYGHRVQVLCAQGGYLGRTRQSAHQWYRGVEIERVFSSARGKSSSLDRMVDYGSFLAGVVAGLMRAKAEVFVCMSTPPMLLTAVANVLRARPGAKLVYWAQDIYPELAGALGALPEGSLYLRSLGRLQRASLKRCDRIITLGRAMQERLCREVDGCVPCKVIPNWADGGSIKPMDRTESALRRQLPSAVETVVMYSGNMGRGHDIETMLEAARRLSGRKDLAFVFVGDGAKSGLVDAAAAKLPNVHKFGYSSKEALSESLAAGDIHLASLLPEALGLMEPSKVYGIMAAGRPCLFVGPEQAEVAQALLRSGAGVVSATGDAATLAETIVSLADDQAKLLQMGQRARAAFTALYDRPIASRAFNEALLGLTS